MNEIKQKSWILVNNAELGSGGGVSSGMGLSFLKGPLGTTVIE